jgi:hypothetical protein
VIEEITGEYEDADRVRPSPTVVDASRRRRRRDVV